MGVRKDEKMKKEDTICDKFLESEGCNVALREYLVEVNRDEPEKTVVLEPGFLDSAVVGFEDTSGPTRLVCSWEKLVIDYNTLRSLPYMGALAPIVMRDVEGLE